MMKIELRPVVGLERLYLYPQQHQELILASGAIGCLSGHLESDCMAFERNWTTYRHYANMSFFAADIQEIFEFLTESSDCDKILASRQAMTEYCRNHPDGYFKGTHINECGYRLDTVQYTYMIRVLPGQAAEPNFWIFAYHRCQLDDHLKRSKNGIGFPYADSELENFHIEDGDFLCIEYNIGGKHAHVVKQCRYYDNGIATCVLVGNEAWSVSNFVKKHHENGCTIIPLRESLPPRSYIVFDDELPLYKGFYGQIGEIRRGQAGIYPTLFGNRNDPESNRRMAASMNRLSHVNNAQESAMLYGCLHSWSEPGANPCFYNEDGTIK